MFSFKSLILPVDTAMNFMSYSIKGNTYSFEMHDFTFIDKYLIDHIH